MKKLLVFLMSFVVLCSAVLAVDEQEVMEDVPETDSAVEEAGSLVDSLPALVDEATSAIVDGESSAEVSPGGNSFYILTSPADDDTEDVTYAPVSIDDPDVTITDISLASVSPITPSSTSGLKAALLGILGNYDPVVVEYQYASGNGYTNYLREIQPDYVWLCSAALLALVIYCLFKLGGGLLRG